MKKNKRLIYIFMIMLSFILIAFADGMKNGSKSFAEGAIKQLGSDTIKFETYSDISIQFPCEEKGGIYFLNNNELSFYNMTTGTTTLLESFYCEGKYYNYTDVLDACVVGNNLYVLVFSYSYYEGEKPTVIVYDLLQQKISQNIKLTVSADCITADKNGRMIVAYDKNIYLLSAGGALLGNSTANENIYNVTGFNSNTGDFYVVGYMNWIYWGYNHDMNVLRKGKVTGNSISVDSNCNIIIAQKYFYDRQRQVEPIGDKYLAVDNTFNNELQILDTASYSTSVDEPKYKLALQRNNTELGEFDNKACVGTRTVYCAGRDSIITYKDSNSIAEYKLSDGSEIGCMNTRYPVFSLLQYGNDIIAIEKNGDKFYLERFVWTHPTKVTLSAASSTVKVGEETALKTTVNGTLSCKYTFTSSNSKVASVNASGTVTAWQAGKAVITVTTNSGLKASCTITVTKNTQVKNPPYNVYSMGGDASYNVSANNYYVWGNIVKSYLYQDSDGTLNRVEYTNGKVIVEKYTSDGRKLRSRKNIKMELPIFGGFYSGKNHNYIVFGRKNPKDSDTAVVMRVVKYSKDWKRIRSVSYKGCNTYIPFEAGSLRMTEADGKLYIHTCHEMYKSSDGLHHQANMTYVIKQKDMSKVQQYYDVMNLAQAGYVSHSFNQFIQADDGYIYRVDHGDFYPRGIAITRCLVSGDITDVEYTIPVSLDKVSGYNDTGASIGGFEISADKCLIAGNAVNYKKTANSGDVRNIFVSVTDKALTTTNVKWFTSYKENDNITVRTPQLVKINNNRFMLLWEEINSKGTVKTAMLTLDGAGNATSEVVRKNIRLSDCNPVYCSDGNIRWYVSSDDAPILYTVSPYLISSVKTKQSSISNAKVSKISAKTYTGKLIKPTVRVTLNGRRLTKNVEYSVVYQNNRRVGEAKVIIRGFGKYKGTIVKTFKIKPKKVTGIKASSSNGRINVKWKADSQVSGYQVVYAENSKFTKNKRYKYVTKKTSNKINITGLVKGKKYYVKVRSYKKVGGKKLYGSYSITRTIKIK